MKNTNVKQKNLVSIGCGFAVFASLIGTHNASVATSPYYIEASNNEITKSEEMCRGNLVKQQQGEDADLAYEGIMTAVEFVDTENGIQAIISQTEQVYSNGVRRLYDPDTGMNIYVRPDGSEALPGEEVELPGGRVIVVSRVEEEIRNLELHLQDDNFWNAGLRGLSAEQIVAYREVFERQLENLRELVD